MAGALHDYIMPDYRMTVVADDHAGLGLDASEDASGARHIYRHSTGRGRSFLETISLKESRTIAQTLAASEFEVRDQRLFVE